MRAVTHLLAFALAMLAQALILPEQGYAILIVTNQGGGVGETAVVGLTQLAMGAVKDEQEKSR